MRVLDAFRLIVPGRLVDLCEGEARRAFPLETGGAFMGRRRDGDLLVEHLIGPGPGADHRRRSFEPDATYQWAEMARIHRVTAGRAGYLGDWHTHPRCRGGELSALDVQALDEILGSPRSRVESVVFAILSGGRRRWRWTGHLASRAGAASLIGSCAIERGA